MTKLSFNLAKLIDSNPCLNGVSRLSKSLTEPYDGTTAVNYYDHIEHVTAEDLLWVLKLTQLSELDQRTIYVRVAIYVARSVLHIFEREHPNDRRPRRAIEAAERCVDENFSVESLSNVRRAIELAAGAAARAARTPALAATRAATWAALAATRTAALAATRVALAAARAALAAARAPDDPDALRADIKTYFLELIRSYDD
jgi:hypothetical protein